MGIVSGIIAGSTDTSDATAAAYHIKTGKTAYISSGEVTGTAYTPALMLYNGTNSYYQASYTSGGNKVTAVARFKTSSFTGGSSKVVLRAYRAGPLPRISMAVISSDHATTTRRNKLLAFVSNTSGTTVAQLVSASNVNDGAIKTVFVAYDGDAGTAVMRINGEDELDTTNAEHILTTGTLSTGATTTFFVGTLEGPTLLWNGQIGFVGMADAGGLDWSDFMQADGSPIYQNTSNWGSTGWGAQPLFWNPHGDMENNYGSAADMTKNGNFYVGDAGAT